jgi:hypothetical protein
MVEPTSVTSINSLVPAINNEYTHNLIKKVKAEFQFYYRLLNEGFVFDYAEVEDRKLNAKLVSGRLTGVEAEKAQDHLNSQNREFTGAVKFGSIQGKITTKTGMDMCLGAYNSRLQIRSIAEGIKIADVQKQVMLGRTFARWASDKKEVIDTSAVNALIEIILPEMKAGYGGCVALLANLNNLVKAAESSVKQEQNWEVSPDLLDRYVVDLTEKESKQVQEFFSICKSLRLESIGRAFNEALIKLLASSLEMQREYENLEDARLVQEELESCGIHFLSPIRVPILLERLRDSGIVPNAKITFSANRAKSISVRFTPLISLMENSLMNVGDEL